MAATNFRLELEFGAWRAVNDGVMGGVSVGEMVAGENDTLRFQGRLSLENNGGFASVRRLIDSDLKGIEAIRLKVRGDSRRYQFRLRTDKTLDGIAWRQTFETDGSWQTIDLQLRDFVPAFRGRIIRGADPLDLSRVRQLGFLLADGRPGWFQLEITTIEFLSNRAEP